MITIIIIYWKSHGIIYIIIIIIINWEYFTIYKL